jgi:PKD repeat protein
MKSYILVFLIYLIIFLCNHNIAAQGPPISWTKVYGLPMGNEAGLCIRSTYDGEYIISGAIEDPYAPFGDAWLIKINSLGDTLWTERYGYFGTDMFYEVQQTSDSGFIAIGRTEYDDIGQGDIFLIKTDENGLFEWERTYGGNQHETGFSVKQTLDNGFILIGNTYSYGNGNSDIWVIKTNQVGDTLWTRLFGGIYSDYGKEVIVTDDSCYVITGKIEATNDDLFLIKLDNVGNVIWNKIYDGGSIDWGESLIQTQDHGFIVVGGSDSFAPGPADVWVLKTDSQGDTLWTKQFGTLIDEVGMDVKETSDSNYVIVGTSFDLMSTNHSDVWINQIDYFGNEIWRKFIDINNNFDKGFSLEINSNEDIYIVGSSQNSSTSLHDIYILKLDVDSILVDFIATEHIGKLPFTTQFLDSSINISFWEWDFENDGIIDSYEQNPSHTYFEEDTFAVKLIASNGFMTDSLIRENYITTYFDSFPNLYNIKDVPNDQGGWVFVNFARSLYDTDTLIHPKFNTEIYTVESNYDSTWTAVNSTVAYGISYYSVLVPTTKDSTAYSNGLIDFRIIAGMDEGNFVCNVLSGYSIDNLEPNAPHNLQGVLVQDTIVTLQWSANKDDDLQYYSVYLSIDGINFELINELNDTTLIDTIDIPIDSVMYGIKAVDYSGNYSTYSNFVNFEITNIPNDVDCNFDFRLNQNYPNPFNPITKFKFEIPKPENVKIDIFNVLGQKIETLLDKQMQNGIHEIEFNGKNLPSGVYLYRIDAGKFQEVKKMILLR